MVEQRRNCIMPRDYLDLIARSGNKKCKEINAVGAIRESLYTTGVYNDDQLIAFGRICGDGFLQMIVCDIMVDSRYAGKNLEAVIVKDIEDYLRESVNSDTSVLVVTDTKTSRLFARFGYKYFDEDFELAMRR